MVVNSNLYREYTTYWYFNHSVSIAIVDSELTRVLLEKSMFFFPQIKLKLKLVSLRWCRMGVWSRRRATTDRRRRCSFYTTTSSGATRREFQVCEPEGGPKPLILEYYCDFTLPAAMTL